jgi:hypothetical protein
MKPGVLLNPLRLASKAVSWLAEDGGSAAAAGAAGGLALPAATGVLAETAWRVA